MAKYIDVESLVVGYSGHTPDDEFSKGVDFVLDLLDSKPPEDVRPVVRGRWEVHIFDGIMGGRPRALMCTFCNTISLSQTRFCPNCGADMKEETKE